MRFSMAIVLGCWLAALPAQELERAIQAAEALGARTGVAVVDDQGHVLFRHRAAEAFAPASNLKVLSAAAVLQGLGADHAFVTRFALRAGRLVVTASGDPNWITGSAHSPDVIFGEVAAALQRMQVTTLRGIDYDAGTFVGPDRPATWPQDQLYTYYCAPTGPFVLEQGTFSVAIAASSGATADLHIAAPLTDLPVRNSVQMVNAAKGATYGAIDQGTLVQVRGKFYRRSSPVTIRTAAADPATWYDAALRRALGRAGITIEPGATVSAADGVVHEYRTAIASAILRMLEDSSNFDAEQCVRVLGQHTAGDGSLAGGLGAMHAQLKVLLGSIPEGVVLQDGSGLSKNSRVTPAMLVAALSAVQRGHGGKVLRDALPIAGRTGTLEGRFEHTDLVGRVHAKTGWIRGASALSGLVERRDGSVRWFSILMNYDPKKDGFNKELKELQEKMVAAIDKLGAER